jgi:hypothetical protein
MSEVINWSSTAANNNDTPPDGFPENMAYSAVNDSAREVMAAIARDIVDTRGYLIATGTDTAIEVTPTRDIQSYTVGLTIAFVAAFDNNQQPTTLDVNNVGAVALLTAQGADPLLIAGSIYVASYSAGGTFQIMNDLGEGPQLLDADRLVVSSGSLGVGDFRRLVVVTGVNNLTLSIPDIGVAGDAFRVLFVDSGSITPQITFDNISGEDLFSPTILNVSGNLVTGPEGFYTIRRTSVGWILTDY